MSQRAIHTEGLHDIPTKCPVTGGPLFVSELTSHDSGITIRGRFKLPAVSRLDPEQQRILEVFLRARGVISTMEKELGLSYPTVRARIDGMLDAMGLAPYKDSPKKPKNDDVKRRILEQLEEGQISAEEAKQRLREVSA